MLNDTGMGGMVAHIMSRVFSLVILLHRKMVRKLCLLLFPCSVVLALTLGLVSQTDFDYGLHPSNNQTLHRHVSLSIAQICIWFLTI